MNNKDAPCNGCTAETGRTPTCKFDGTCDKYAKWKAEHERQREEMWRQKKVSNSLRGYAVDLAARLKKEGHR